MRIAGSYHDGKTSRCVNAHLERFDDDPESVRIAFISDDETSDTSVTLQYSELKIASRLGNTPREIAFGDGRLFVTEDNDAVDLLIRQHGKSDTGSLLHRLENNSPLILASVVVTIAIIWATVIYGIPASARIIAFELPDFASEKLGSSLTVLDNTVFEASELSDSRQAEVSRLTAPYLEIYKDLQPRLNFRSGMGANALALPSGDIVLTDDFVNLVENDQQLLAVFFHEIGHLQHKHLLRRALQDSMVTLLIIFVTGDVDTFDLITGLPTLVLDLSYSREFEREADVFALEQLQKFNIPVDHFAAVMTRLEAYYAEQSEDNKNTLEQVVTKDEQTDNRSDEESISDFFSTHPGTDERIELIKQFKLNHKIND
ncbi:MAG: M48 family metallopeptidase [Gammaproteobacteria bacterium]|nr:M48 family metallopeptidase [Gammaproteobacteria bacterium]